MRFAITATDRYLGVLEAFLGQGWQLVKLFTAPVDGRMHHNKAVTDVAKGLRVPIQMSPITDHDLAALAQDGCDVLIVASYPWRIPDWAAHLPHCINFHPAPLPEGRGPYPSVQALLDNRSTWGVSCHKVTREFDAGDILASWEFPLASDDCHETLDFKIQMAVRRLASDVAQNFHEYWSHARPQASGTYYPMWSQEDRTLDFNLPIESILRKTRAFGLFECLAVVNGVTISIRRAVGWQEEHAFPPGSLVHRHALSMVVAAVDGYVAIIEWHLFGPDATLGSVRR